jgi:predicted ATP-grasp superfamily ATP-dependent carboligase
MQDFGMKPALTSETARRVLLVASIDAIGIARLPSLFAAAGFRVVLLGPPHTAVSKSKFIAERIPCARGVDATVAALREHLGTHRSRYHSVVIADEPSLLAASEGDSPEWLKDWFPVPVAGPYLARIRSKVCFLRDSREAGLPVMQFEVCSDEPQLRAAVKRIGFPLFIKSSTGFAGAGLLFARTPADLESQLHKVTFDEPVLVQEEIVGETGSIPVLYDRGRPICWFAYRMKLTWPTRFSSACTVAISANDEIEGLVRGVGELTQFNGLCGLDWMWDRRSRRIVLLEFNPRPLPTAYLGPCAGVDFSRALQNADSPESVVQKPTRSGAAVDLFPQALYYGLQHREPRRILRAFSDAPWNDPLLTAAHLRRFITHHIPVGFKQALKKS